MIPLINEVPMLTAAIEWLYTYLLHSTILLGAAWVATKVLPFGSASSKDIVWKTAAFGALITATIAFTLDLPSVVDPIEIGTLSAQQEEHLGARQYDSLIAATDEVIADAMSSEMTENTSAIPVVDDPLRETTRPFRFGVLLSLLWVCGFALSLTSFLLARRRFLAEIGPRSSVQNGSLLDELEFLKETSGLTGEIGLTESFQLRSAVVVNSREICLPSRIHEELSDEEQRSMLAHEFAHVVRRDPMWLNAYNVLCSVFFMQPLNFLARRHYREAAEHACDSWVATRTGLGDALASCLVKVAAWIRGSYVPAPFTGIAGSPLRVRVERLVSGQTEVPTPWLLAGSVAMIVGVGAFTPQVNFYRTSAQPISEWGPTEILKNYNLLLSPDDRYAPAIKITFEETDRWNTRTESGNDIEIRGNGTVEIDPQTRTVVSVEPRAYMEYSQLRDGKVERRLRFEGTSGGEFKTAYWFEGSKVRLSDEALDWAAECTSSLVRMVREHELRDSYRESRAMALAERERELAQARNDRLQSLNREQLRSLDDRAVAQLRASELASRSNDQLVLRRRELEQQYLRSADQLKEYLADVKSMDAEERAALEMRARELAQQSRGDEIRLTKEAIERLQQARADALASSDANRARELELKNREYQAILDRLATRDKISSSQTSEQVIESRIQSLKGQIQDLQSELQALEAEFQARQNNR